MRVDYPEHYHIHSVKNDDGGGGGGNDDDDVIVSTTTKLQHTTKKRTCVQAGQQRGAASAVCVCVCVCAEGGFPRAKRGMGGWRVWSVCAHGAVQGGRGIRLSSRACVRA